MGKYIQPMRMFGKLSNSLSKKVCLSFDDLIFADISPFAVGLMGRGIEN